MVAESLREIGQEQLSVPLDITAYRGGLTTAVVVYEYWNNFAPSIAHRWEKMMEK